MPFIPLQCPNCGANLTVDSDKDAAICEFCGRPYIVKEAIIQTHINSLSTSINAENVNVYTQKDFNIVAGCLKQYTGEDADVVIPSNVVAIGKDAFKEQLIRSVSIPDSVTSIEEGAFSKCTALTSIHIPDSVTSIGDGAFNSCSSLTSIRIPDSVTSIGGGAFYCCTSLTSIRIPDGVTSIKQMTFSHCSSLTSIRIPDGVISIELGAFVGCSSLSSIYIPDSVSHIDLSAFLDCNSLSKIDFKNWPKFQAFDNLPAFKASLKKENRCTYCGGQFQKGLFRITCQNCHKPKNY